MYEYGDYTINEKEYRYLMGMYKKKTLTNLGLSESDLDSEISPGLTYSEHFENVYRADFEQGVLSLVVSQAMFDELGLSMTEEEENNIINAANSLILALGGGSELGFNNIAKEYGFDAKALRSVYLMQAKESMLIDHLYGDDYSNVTDEEKSAFYEENYIHFQVFVVNTVYKKYVSPSGEESFVGLTDSQKEYKERLAEELKKLLVDKDMEYSYAILADKTDWTYEMLWEEYSDDKEFSQGVYFLTPTVAQMMNSNTLSAASSMEEGECKQVVAKLYFEKSGAIEIDGEYYAVDKGEAFEYGFSIVKRLPLEENAFMLEENEDFFGSLFLANVAQESYYTALDEFVESSYATLKSYDRREDISFSDVLANELDYIYLYPENEEE